MHKKNFRWYRILYKGKEIGHTHSPLNYLKLWVQKKGNRDIVFMLET